MKTYEGICKCGHEGTIKIRRGQEDFKTQEEVDKWLDNRISGNNYKKKGKKDDHNWFKEIEKTTRDTEVC